MAKIKKQKYPKTWLRALLRRWQQYLRRKPAVAWFSRWGAASITAVFILSIILSGLWPKNEFRLLQEKLAVNPSDTEALLNIAEKLLAVNQLEETEKVLRLAKSYLPPASGVDNLLIRKQLSDPRDIRSLITFWEKIITQKPDYRDGYLQLAILHYKLSENAKARAYLEKAKKLDPNFELTEEISKALGEPQSN